MEDDRDVLLHLLRNPHGWSEEAVREARIKAADELERLWRFERNTLMLANQITKLN